MPKNQRSAGRPATKTAPTQAKGKTKAPQRTSLIRRPRTSTPPGSESEEDDAITDVEQVTGPVMSLVHDRMRKAWKVNPLNPMWLIFDAVNPVRTFKIDMPYDEDADFPVYGEDEVDNLTEVDEEPPGLMPYAPLDYRRVHGQRCTSPRRLTGASPRSKYRFKCEIRSPTFMNWRPGELRDMEDRKSVV